jgi:biopolymer transport protein TolR
MAGGMDLGTGPKGGKKNLDAALNLVPFIDVMAVTIIFLIMSAVLTQVGRLQVSQSGQSTEDNTPPPTTLPITLLITEKELKLSVGGSALDAIPVVPDEKGRVDMVRLIAKLKELKTSQPEQNAITLQTEDAVRYDVLVQVIDTCIGNAFPAISVSPASSS